MKRLAEECDWSSSDEESEPEAKKTQANKSKFVDTILEDGLYGHLLGFYLQSPRWYSYQTSLSLCERYEAKMTCNRILRELAPLHMDIVKRWSCELHNANMELSTDLMDRTFDVAMQLERAFKTWADPQWYDVLLEPMSLDGQQLLGAEFVPPELNELLEEWLSLLGTVKSVLMAKICIGQESVRVRGDLVRVYNDVGRFVSNWKAPIPRPRRHMELLKQVLQDMGIQCHDHPHFRNNLVMALVKPSMLRKIFHNYCFQTFLSFHKSWRELVMDFPFAFWGDCLSKIADLMHVVHDHKQSFQDGQWRLRTPITFGVDSVEDEQLFNELNASQDAKKWLCMFCRECFHTRIFRSFLLAACGTFETNTSLDEFHQHISETNVFCYGHHKMECIDKEVTIESIDVSSWNGMVDTFITFCLSLTRECINTEMEMQNEHTVLMALNEGPRDSFSQSTQDFIQQIQELTIGTSPAPFTTRLQQEKTAARRLMAGKNCPGLCSFLDFVVPAEPVKTCASLYERLQDASDAFEYTVQECIETMQTLFLFTDEEPL